MGGKVSAEYYRRYRSAHPELRERYNELRRRRRALHGRGDRTAEYQKRAKHSISDGNNGVCLESSIVRRAREIVLTKCRPDRRTTLWDDRFEDLVGEVVVALCEGTDPHEAMREWMRGYWCRRYRHLPLED